MGPFAGIPVEKVGPEAELLLRCARPRMGPEHAARVREILGRPLDWRYLFDLSRRHATLPLLYANLSACCPDAVPDDVIAEPRDRFHRNTLRNLILTRALLRLLRLFEAHGIPAITYRGPALAASVYGDLALRQFDDLDILVRERDVSKAAHLLVHHGYGAPFHLPASRAIAFSKTESQCTFSQPDSAVFVELHWRAMPGYFCSSPASEDLLKRIDTVAVSGGRVPTLSPVDLLPSLCARGSRRRWRRLSWICDVAELVRAHRGMDWAQVIARSERFGGKHMLYLGLLLAHDLLDAPLPEEVRREARSHPLARSLAEEVRGGLFSEPLPQRVLSWHLRLVPSLTGRIRYCLLRGMVPTLSDWALLPCSWVPCSFYGVLRPLRLVAQLLPAPLPRLFRH